jgi:dienelactone hydrolase
MDIYGSAQHGFTNPYADGYGIKGLSYNELADQRSWRRMKAFLQDAFGETL